MITFIPYHEDLPVRYDDLAQSIRKAGTNPNHTLAVISLRSQDEGAFMFSNHLTDYFGRIVKVSIDDRPEAPTSLSNRFFNAALDTFLKYKPTGKEPAETPMMYFDPTYIPCNPRWLDDLQADFFRMGAPKVFADFNTDKVTRGPVILSREYVRTATLRSFIPQGEHWRNYLAWELFKFGVEATGIGYRDSAVVAPRSLAKSRETKKPA